MNGIFMALSAALIWGSVPVASKVVMQEVSPMLLAFLRVLIAAVFLFACRGLVKEPFRKPTKEEWVLLAIGGVIGLGGNYVLYQVGLNLTTAISTQLIVQSETVFLILASAVFLNEKMTKKKTAATATAMIGVLIVVWNGHDLSALLGMRTLFGDILILLAALAWTVFALAQKMLHKKYSAYQLVTYMFILASVALAPIGIPEVPQLFSAGPLTLVLLAYLGIIGTGLAYLLFAESTRNTPVSTIAAVILVNPLATVVFSKIFLAEQVTGYSLFGGALLLGSLYLVAR
jgi:drug/metabolite transporter (DMT)-like permease